MGGIVEAIVNVVTSFIGWLIPIPDIPEFDTPEEERGVLINKQSNNAQIPVVYGRRQVGITRVFVESSGTDNQYLYMAGVLCEGEIDEVEQVFIDDKRVFFEDALDHGVVREVNASDSNFYKDSSHIQVQAFNGTDTQVASSILTNSTNWTSNHKLSGVAYLAFRFKWNQDIFSSIPQVRVTLKGKKIFDPRDSATKWTPNSALVLLDYLRNTRYGKGLPDSAFESDFASFKTSANDADTLIQPRTTSVTEVAGLYRENYNGYFGDYPSYFTNRSIISTGTTTSITVSNPGNFKSHKYSGYFTAPSSASFTFKTESDDGSAVYIGDANQTVDNLSKQIEANRGTKLVVNNFGLHGNTGREGSKTLVSGSAYPLIIVYGDNAGVGNLNFLWKVSGGSFSSDLSSNFTNGKGVTDVIPAIIKFESNAVVDTSQKVIENVKKLLNPMRSLFTYNNGVYKLKIEGTGSSVKTITSDHVVGGAKVLGERKNNKFNRVIGTYVNPYKNWQNDTVSFPPADDSNVITEFKHATMLSADNDTLLEGNFEFPNVTNTYNAEALCEVILRRSRNQLQIQLTLTSEFLELEIGDIVAITYASGGFNAKPFRVLGIEINEDLTVNVQLFEHQDNFYDFNTKNPIPTIPDTTLPNPNSIQAPAISLSDELFELFDGSVVSKLIVNITSTDAFTDQFEVEYKESTSSSYRLMRRGSNSIVEKYPVKEGLIYDVRVRAINAVGVKSTYTTAQHEVNSAFTPPDNVTNYSIDVVGDKLYHSFDAVTNLDLDFYEIRFTSNTNETAYANTTVLVPRIGRPATSVTTPFVGTGKYFIKAVDKFGIRSTDFASQVISAQVVGDKIESVQTLTEHSAFTGTKSNVVAVSNNLQLDTSINFDSHTGNFDDGLGFFDGGSGAIVSSGTYDFANAFDFNSVLKFNVLLSSFIVNNINFVNNFDSASGNFDARQGLFDGGSNASVDTNAILQISTSQDASTYTSFQDFKAGDFVARAVKFRLKLTSSNTQESPQVSALALKLSLPIRTEKGSNISSTTSTSGKTITFGSEYYQTPSLTVIGQNMATGDFFTITSKGTASFVVEFFNSSGSTVDRTFDYQAIGIGQKQ
jgi:hypothetical protein